ncbi:ABC transporter ATP-binding protein/permease [Rhodanobacter sp. PCA2]|uniref:ABC transporter ATP-binding protein/permease n=1 Tax=Rhodanobacter sp. PCA2 TaxID=2006117 RepID=UPI0015E6FD9D|nr:ABC transporter ATP-binding protein/permease [Rhodanobacter sp. PCA2]
MSNDAGGHRPRLFQLIYPYWVSNRSWKSWLLVACLLAYSFGGVYLAVWANRLTGEVVDAMVKRDWEQLWPVLLTTVGVGVAGVVATLTNYVASQLLNLEWRAWMTDRYLNAWAEHGAYYEIEREGLLTNADQRLSQDIQMFIQDTLTLSFGVIHVVVTIISFTVVLWQLSGTLSFTVHGWHVSIPGYMVYIAFLYQIISFTITHYSGRALIRLLSHKQTVEANFRYLGMQLRENSEQIAFYRGGERERQQLRGHFGDVLHNWKDIIFCTGRMMFFRDTYVQAVGLVVPTLSALPRYLIGAITLGDVTRITGAFNSLTSALSFFTQAYTTFSEWLALGHRLQDFSWALSRAEHLPRNIEVRRHPGSEIETSPVVLALPDGELMAKVPSLRIKQGERWLIRGRSGVGKSTFLRAIAGMWPYGSGTVSLPGVASLMFLPQRSYIPYGKLKAALCYPSESDRFSDEECRHALQECLLGHYAGVLDVEDRWQQKLSGGEQQRLAFARVILHRPAFVFLDEATSALDGESESRLYSLLIERLPNSAVISVAHREALETFHDHVLVIQRPDDTASSPYSTATA